jgi:hypothetical protein
MLDAADAALITVRVISVVVFEQIRNAWGGALSWSRLPVSETNVVSTLKIEPELTAGTKPMSQAQRGITKDRPLALNDLRDPIGWHSELTRELGRCELELCQLLSEDFPRMDGGPRHCS